MVQAVCAALSSATSAVAAAAVAAELPASQLLARAGGTFARHQHHHAAAASAMLQLLPPTAAAASAASPWRLQHARGYAQMGTRMPRVGYKPPVEMQKSMQMRLSMVSANVLAEPYRGVLPPQRMTAYFTLGGWKEVWRRLLGQFKNLYTLAKCK